MDPRLPGWASALKCDLPLKGIAEFNTLIVKARDLIQVLCSAEVSQFDLSITV